MQRNVKFSPYIYIYGEDENSVDSISLPIELLEITGNLHRKFANSESN